MVKKSKKDDTWFGALLVRKLTKLGGASYGVTLPIGAVRKFKWQEGQNIQLTIDEKNKRIVIEDWQG